MKKTQAEEKRKNLQEVSLRQAGEDISKFGNKLLNDNQYLQDGIEQYSLRHFLKIRSIIYTVIRPLLISSINDDSYRPIKTAVNIDNTLRSFCTKKTTQSDKVKMIIELVSDNKGGTMAEIPNAKKHLEYFAKQLEESTFDECIKNHNNNPLIKMLSELGVTDANAKYYKDIINVFCKLIECIQRVGSKQEYSNQDLSQSTKQCVIIFFNDPFNFYQEFKEYFQDANEDLAKYKPTDSVADKWNYKTLTTHHNIKY